MSFTANIEKMNVRKYALVVLKPRRYITDWELVSGDVYSTDFSLGRVTRMWNQYGNGELVRKTALADVTAGDFYHDLRSGILYVGAVSLPPNRTAEYEIHLSDEPWTGPADPLDSTSEVVDWIPALDKEPLPQNGSRDTQFGFSPLLSSSVLIDNADGWLNEHLHESSFHQARAKGYCLATKLNDLGKAMTAGDVKATFTGFCGRSISGLAQISVPIVDFFGILDQPAESTYTYNSGTILTAPGVRIPDPAASVVNNEWSVRRLRGVLYGLIPVNIDYDVTPATNKNRYWVTHEDDEEDGDTGTLTYTPVVTGSTATKTILAETPQCQVGDWVVINRGGTEYPRVVLTVDQAGKFITHAAIGVSQDGGRTCVRWHVQPTIEVDGVSISLEPTVDYTLYAPGTPAFFGFQLVNNFEAGHAEFGGNPFDPSVHTVTCLVYGRKTPDKYSDGVTDVGFCSNNGGVDSSAVGILYRLLILAGILPEEIDETTFQAVGADSHSLGLAWPQEVSGAAPTYKDLITLVLQSMLWRLAFVQSGDDIKIGLVAQAPMSTADQDAVESELALQDYEHDYGDIYSRVKVRYAIRERNPALVSDSYVLADNTLARDLHFITKTFSMDALQFLTAEAQEITDHLAFMLGDRRAFYTLKLEQRFIDKANLGTSFDISREQLPGFAFVPGTARTRRLIASEVQKSTEGVTLVLEDQKGIQDNSGGW